MSVHDLSRNELDELKQTYFDQLCDTGEIEDVCPDATFYTDIPDDIIFDHYEGIEFVTDDFFCNIESEEE